MKVSNKDGPGGAETPRGPDHKGELVIESSVAQPKGSHPRTNTVVDRIEREIARLKAARPHLATRVERAEHIIVTHLSTAHGTHRPVKVRVHADGSRSYSVRSCGKWIHKT